jgi:hypothetical protein
MLNRFEAFNLSMMSKMQNRRPQQSPQAGASAPSGARGAATQAIPGSQDVIMADATASQGTGGGTSSGVNLAGAAKKKKPKKKK